MDKKIMIVPFLTTIAQYYNYHLLGFLAPQVAQSLMAPGDSITQLSSIYLIIAFSSLAKPLCSVGLGYISDIYSRKHTILIGLITNSIATFCIALIPDYNTAGIFSVISLSIMRTIVTCFSAGSNDSTRIYVYEKIGSNHKHLGLGIVNSCSVFGSFLASTTAFFLGIMFPQNYSWRVAFIIGAFLNLIIFQFAKTSLVGKINEKEDQNPNTQKVSIFSFIKNNPKTFGLYALLAGTIGSTYQFYMVFFGTYCAKILKIIELSNLEFYRSIATLIYIFATISSGMLNDRLTKMTSFLNLSACSIFAVNIFLAHYISSGIFKIGMYLSLAFLIPFMTIPALSIFTSSIPVSIRGRIFSLTHGIGASLISGPTPYIATNLYKKTLFAPIVLVYFSLVVFCLALSSNIIYKSNNKNKNVM